MFRTECLIGPHLHGIGIDLTGQDPSGLGQWVTADDDAILVYGAIDGYMMNRYELVALERDD
ncbi:MAG: hypothetical protein ACK4G2_07055 [Novosphingobium sp.]